MTASPMPPTNDFLSTHSMNKATKEMAVALIFVAVAVIVSTTTMAYITWENLTALEATVDNLQFNQFLSNYRENTGVIQPTVNPSNSCEIRGTKKI